MYRTTASRLLRQQLPSLHHAIRIQRNGRDALHYQPLRKVGVVAGGLGQRRQLTVDIMLSRS